MLGEDRRTGGDTRCTSNFVGTHPNSRRPGTFLHNRSRTTAIFRRRRIEHVFFATLSSRLQHLTRITIYQSRSYTKTTGTTPAAPSPPPKIHVYTEVRASFLSAQTTNLLPTARLPAVLGTKSAAVADAVHSACPMRRPSARSRNPRSRRTSPWWRSTRRSLRSPWPCLYPV